jgi:hypothetical protein
VIPEKEVEEEESDDQMEFLLAVDDLQSVISYRGYNTSQQYTLNNQVDRKRNERTLNDLFKPANLKRVKLSEGLSCTTNDTVYDMEDMNNHLKTAGSVKIEKDVSTMKR